MRYLRFAIGNGKVHFVRPYTIFCPAELFDRLLAPLWPALLQHLTAHLSEAWAEYAQRSAPGVGATSEATEHDSDDEDPSDAIIQERELRDLTRTWADLMVLIFHPHQQLGACWPRPHGAAIMPSTWFTGSHVQPCVRGACADKAAADRVEADKDDTVLKHLVALSEYFLRQVAIAEPLLVAVVQALQWKDTMCCRRMVAVAQQVLAWSAAHQHAYAEFLAGHLLRAALSVRLGRVSEGPCTCTHTNDIDRPGHSSRAAAGAQRRVPGRVSGRRAAACDPRLPAVESCHPRRAAGACVLAGHHGRRAGGNSLSAINIDRHKC